MTARGLGIRGIAIGIAAMVAIHAMLTMVGAPAWVVRLPQMGLVTLAATFAAARFEPDDPPRRAWTLLAIGPAIGLCGGIANAAQLTLGSIPLGPALIVLGNLFWMSAVLAFVVLIRRSGLASPLTGAWIAATVAVAVVTVGLGAAALAPLLGAPTTTASEMTWLLRRVVGVVADVVAANAAATVVRMVRGMRGGSAAEPYLLLGVSAVTLLVVGLGLTVWRVNTQDVLPAWLGLVDAAGWACMGLAAVSQARLLGPRGE